MCMRMFGVRKGNWGKVGRPKVTNRPWRTGVKHPALPWALLSISTKTLTCSWRHTEAGGRGKKKLSIPRRGAANLLELRPYIDTKRKTPPAKEGQETSAQDCPQRLQDRDWMPQGRGSNSEKVLAHQASQRLKLNHNNTDSPLFQHKHTTL